MRWYDFHNSYTAGMAALPAVPTYYAYKRHGRFLQLFEKMKKVVSIRIKSRARHFSHETQDTWEATSNCCLNSFEILNSFTSAVLVLNYFF